MAREGGGGGHINCRTTKPHGTRPVEQYPLCENDTHVPKLDGNNTQCCSDMGVLIRGEVGHGSRSCGNSTDCRSDKMAVFSKKRGVKKEYY